MANTYPLALSNYLLEQAILGMGLKSPMVTNPANGDFLGASGEQNLTNCVTDLLDTRVGERLMNEDVGTTIPSTVFENLDVAVALLSGIILDALQRYEPRVTNVKISLQVIPPTQVNCNLSWRVIGTSVIGNLVWPFYLSPPSGGVSQAA